MFDKTKWTNEFFCLLVESKMYKSLLGSFYINAATEGKVKVGEIVSYSGLLRIKSCLNVLHLEAASHESRLFTTVFFERFCGRFTCRVKGVGEII
jgi:hypothetical protein